MIKQERPLLIVKWKDHCAEGGWASVEKFHVASECYSVGWLYKEDDEAITLVANYSPNGSDTHNQHTTGNLQYILKASIVHRVVIVKPAK